MGLFLEMLGIAGVVLFFFALVLGLMVVFPELEIRAIEKKNEEK